MKWETVTLHSLAKALAAGEVSSEEITRSYLERIESLDGEIGAYITVCADEALQQAKEADRRRAANEDVSPLTGVPIAVKDNLCTIGIRTTAASRMLENFVPPYDATVVSRLKQAGMPILGKTNLDEFAMGSSTETSRLGVTRNPWDLTRVPGGSSGGSAAAVAAGLAPASLGSDTGGSIRQPAAYCGIVGLKPTYGRVSRYGLIALAPSMDQVGPMTRTVTDSALLLQAIAGPDPFDGLTADEPVPDYTAGLDQGVKGIKVGVPQDLFNGELADGLDPEVRGAVEGAIKQLESLGAEIVPLKLDQVKHSLATYYVLVTVEASSCLGRFDGVRYGYRAAGAEDVTTMFQKTRAEALGPEVKRRILLGTYFLSGDRWEKYYRKALHARTLVKRDLYKALDECDVIVTPTAPDVAFVAGEKTADPVKMYLSDLFTIPVNLSGLPAVSLPAGLSQGGLPIGVQLIGRGFGESRLLQTAYALENVIGPLPAPPLSSGQAD